MLDIIRYHRFNVVRAECAINVTGQDTHDATAADGTKE